MSKHLNALPALGVLALVFMAACSGGSSSSSSSEPKPPTARPSRPQSDEECRRRVTNLQSFVRESRLLIKQDELNTSELVHFGRSIFELMPEMLSEENYQYFALTKNLEPLRVLLVEHVVYGDEQAALQDSLAAVLKCQLNKESL